MTFVPRTFVLDRLRPVADEQLGYFTAGQARGVGVDRRYLAHHVRSGNLLRAARGVYRIRHYPAHRFEDVMVAVLWAGEGAVASHQTALAVYGLASAMPTVIHLTIDRRFRGTRTGVVVHRGHLADADVGVEGSIPVTSPVRTLADLAGDRSVVREAIGDAFERGLLRRPGLEELVRRRPELEEVVSEVLSG